MLKTAPGAQSDIIRFDVVVRRRPVELHLDLVDLVEVGLPLGHASRRCRRRRRRASHRRRSAAPRASAANAQPGSTSFASSVRPPCDRRICSDRVRRDATAVQGASTPGRRGVSLPRSADEAPYLSGQRDDVDRLLDVAGEAGVAEPVARALRAAVERDHRDAGGAPARPQAPRSASLPSRSGRRRSIRTRSGSCCTGERDRVLAGRGLERVEPGVRGARPGRASRSDRCRRRSARARRVIACVILSLVG